MSSKTKMIVAEVIGQIGLLLLLMLFIYWITFSRTRADEIARLLSMTAFLFVFAANALMASTPGTHLLFKIFFPGMVICEKTSGAILHKIDQKEFYWRWHTREVIARWMPRYSLSTMTAHPITENPKVREIHYTINVGPGNDLASLERLRQSGLWNRSWETLVRRHLFDFNEQRSRELAVFSNPLRDEQQDGFEKLVHRYLATHLAPLGLEVRQARFDLN